MMTMDEMDAMDTRDDHPLGRHLGLDSTPAATIESPSTRRAIRGRGRAGGPPSTRPVDTSKAPLWQGHSRRPAARL